MLSATVAQKPTMPVSDGIKKRRNSALVRNLLGALSTGPRPPALPVIHHNRSRPMPSMKGAPMPSRNLMVSIPRQITAMLSVQKAKKQIQAPPGEGGAHEYRERNAVFGPGVRVEQHGDEHDQVAEQDGADGLPPAHAAGNQAAGQHVGGDAHRHSHPQRSVVIEAPRALLQRNGREVRVIQRRVVPLHYFQAPPRAVRFRELPRPGLPRNRPPSTMTSPRES